MNVQWRGGKHLVDVPLLEDDKKSQVIVDMMEHLIVFMIREDILTREIGDFTENLPYHLYNLPRRSQNALYWLEYYQTMRDIFWTDDNVAVNRNVSNLTRSQSYAKSLWLACMHHMPREEVYQTTADYMMSLYKKVEDLRAFEQFVARYKCL